MTATDIIAILTFMVSSHFFDIYVSAKIAIVDTKNLVCPFDITGAINPNIFSKKYFIT